MGMVDTFKKMFSKAKSFMIPLSMADVYPKSNFNDYNSYLSAAQTISWVYKCVSIRGESIATVKGFVYDQKGEEVKSEGLNKLFTKPNKLMNWFEFKESLNWFLDLTGNAYILKDSINMKNLPTELYLLRPDRMEVVPSRTDFIAGYQYNLDGRKISFKKEDIIHIKLPNPRNPFYGMGKIEACKIVYDTEIAASGYNWNFFKQGASPAAILSNEGVLDNDTYKRLVKQFQSRHTGYKKMQKPLLLEQGTQYKQMGLSQQDMAFMEQRKFTREEILSMFGVPPAKAGILEYASYANTKEQENSYRKDTLKPLLTRLELIITAEIVSLFNPSWTYEFEEVVNRDEKEFMELATTGLDKGLLTPNEARELYLDLPEVTNEPAMNTYYLPMSLIPITGEVAEAFNEELETTPEKQICGHNHKLTDVNQSKAVNIQQLLLRLANLTKRKIGVKYKKATKKYMKELTNEVMDMIDELDTEKGLIITDGKATDFVGRFENSGSYNRYKESMEQISVNLSLGAVDNVSGAMNSEPPTDPLKNPKFKKRIGKLGKRIKGIENTTLQQLDSTLNAGLLEGESIPQLKARVSTVMTRKQGWEAVRIARTESAYSYDSGAIYGYDEAGVKFLDVIGCTMIEPDYDCGKVHVPVEASYDLDFHPNHTGTFVPSFGVGE